MDLYDATIPPLKRLTDAVQRLLACLDDPAQLEARLASDSFSAAEHFCVALGYVARTVMPLMGDEVPEMPMDTDPGAILALAHDMRFLLDQLDRSAFDDADAREITHVAGEAELTQSGRDYALLYALPNAQFHLTLAYATARMAGAKVGKGDLDGFHIYSPGTSFVSDTPLN
ncbi:hypothetical protein GCM10007385_26840 [Tateyamaria omphalii]|uniref:DUF1993 family protein n=1 Tax=Tateyamaria omphalii TaxID=299262 RepID=UPI0016786C7C|nr:DUF1993 family protein [Tateyamaria omphalii]GGX56702.1 hypothetical protein GCM10007385_26840 [Tateyamaria omphalii]